MSLRPNRVALVLLAASLALVYRLTLHPGLASGDSAELQCMSALLGVCHPPGFRFEILAGWLFSRLPIGPSVAWRINLMMVACGVLGCLALHGAVRRITGRILPALVAAATLGFSSVYWAFSTLAEVYVFYGMFLLLAVYATVRFLQGGRAGWLFTAALALGVAVAERPSELAVAPAFLLAVLLARRQPAPHVGRLAAAAALFLLPFVATVSLHLCWYDEQRPWTRDRLLAERVLGRSAEEPGSGVGRLTAALRYCLGLKWTTHAGFDPQETPRDLRQYAWLLSGGGAWTGKQIRKFRGAEPQFPGTSIGAAGLLLALVALLRWKQHPPWVALGLGMFVGNLAFYLWHHPWDNLTFTVPGLAGLALLAGLGAAWQPRGWRSAAWGVLCVAAPLFLLVANYRAVDRSRDPEAQAFAPIRERLLKTDLPRNCVIVGIYWTTVAYRYVLHAEAGRTDIRIVDASPHNWARLANHFVQRGEPTFVTLEGQLDPQTLRRLQQHTEPEFQRVGLGRVDGD